MTAKPADLLDAPVALAPVRSADETPSLALVIQRLAENPSVDVTKLEKIIELQHAIARRDAEGTFNASMASAQADMRPVATDAENPQTRSRYASYAALDRAIRPIYTKHGFGLSFDTGEGAATGWVRVLCHVTHRAGHVRIYHIDMPADGKGAKGGDVMTITHAVGAANSYAMRYLLRMIWNIAVGEDDRDGNLASDAPANPDGFDDWQTDLAATADEGSAALQQAWKASPKRYVEHLVKHYRQDWEAIKAKAAKIAGVK